MWKLSGSDIALLAVTSSLLAAPAVAQPTRTFVSGHGTDSGSCSPSTAPCRTFGYALTQVAPGGEIIALDSAGYGSVTIAQSVTISNPGGLEAGISTGPGATAIAVTAAFGQTVTLRGLTIEGAGVAGNGIVFTGSGTLNVLDCTVRNMTQDGISITPSFGGVVVIADSTVSGNALNGIYATGDGSGSLTLSLSHDKVLNNGSYGFQMTGGSAAYGFATIDSSLIAGNGTGIAMSTAGSNEITTFVTHSRILNNTQSIAVGTGALLRLEGTSVAASFPSSITNNGQIQTFGDNAIVDSVTGNALSSVGLQ